MAQRLWINTVQQLTATAAGLGVVLHHLIHPLDRQQFRTGSWMARLAAPLAVTALAPLRRLKPRAIAGGWFGGVARAAADPLTQLGQFGRKGGELDAQLLDLLLLGQDQLSGTRPATTPSPLLKSRKEEWSSQAISA